MLASLLVSILALTAPALAQQDLHERQAPSEDVAAKPTPISPGDPRPVYPSSNPNWPNWRITCYRTARCPTAGGAAYTWDSVNNNSIVKGCTSLPAGMRSCRLERFPKENGVPAENACQLRLYWEHTNGQCANSIMNLNPLIFEWSWQCGSVYGADIRGWDVDCSKPSGRSGANRLAGDGNTHQSGENAEAESGVGGV